MTLDNISKYVFHGKKIYLSSSYGRRTYVINGKTVTDFHNGWDIVYRKNGVLTSTTVYAVTTGVVTKIGRDSTSGNYIFIKYPSLNLSIFYCHLKKIYLKVGNKVNKNTKVALTGTTGNSTGIHLHLAVKILGFDKWINPSYMYLNKYNYLYASGKYIKVYSKKALYDVNLRKSPTVCSDSLDVVRKGKVVVILKEDTKISNGYAWDKVKYNGKTGYIANKYLKIYEGKTTTALNARIRPGTNYQKITTLKKNRKVTIIVRNYKKVNNLYWDKIKL